MQSVQYLNDFFGPFGTYKDEKDHRFTTPSQWLKCIVPGKAVLERIDGAATMLIEPFCKLVDLLSPEGHPIRDYDIAAQGFEGLLRGCHKQLAPQSSANDFADVARETVEASARMLTHGCTDETKSPPIRAASVETLAKRLFGADGAAEQKAIRGLMILRGMGDKLKDKFSDEPKAKIDETTRASGFTSSSGASKALLDPTYGRRKRSLRRPNDRTWRDLYGRRTRIPSKIRNDLLRSLRRGVRRRLAWGRGRQQVLRAVALDAGRQRAAGGRRPGILRRSELRTIRDLLAIEPDGKEVGTGEGWRPAYLNTGAGIATIGTTAETGDAIVVGQIFHCTEKSAVTIERTRDRGRPARMPARLAELTTRRARNPDFRPSEASRTGFNKTSQLMATELFELLHASGSETKAVVFSDSRQDAARSGAHHRKSTLSGSPSATHH